MTDVRNRGRMLGGMSLVIDGLVKRFGAIVALDGLELSVPHGHVFGFLGSNGAGKTTTMRIALGVLRPDAGSITWNGIDHRELPRPTWGYLPEERGLYPKMTVLQQLVFFAGLQGVPRDIATREARAWLLRFHVPDFADRRAEELSKGNQQKVQFLAAVLHDPQVMLMDEPFTGLRSGEHRPAARGDPGPPGSRQDDRPLDPPDGDGRGDVRVGRDRRPRPDGRRGQPA